MTTESPQVKALRERYQQSLCDKSKMLGELIDTLSSANDEPAGNGESGDAELLADYLHKLAGSAGMYGYDDVALLAREAMSDHRQGKLRDLVLRIAQLRSLLEQYV